MKTLISKIILFTLIAITNCYSQPIRQWVRTYNGPGNGYDYAGPMIIIDMSGNVYVAGSSDGAGTGRDIATIKYNSAGVQQWLQRYNGTGNGYDELTGGIIVDNSGNVYVSGWSTGTAGGNYPHDYILIKYDSSGVQQWVARYRSPVYGPNIIHSMAIDNSGNIIVTGEAPTSTFKDWLTIKYNSTGDTLWTRRYDGGDNGAPEDVAYAAAADASGNIYVTGHITIFPNQKKFATIKYNSSGVQQWIKIIDRTPLLYRTMAMKYDAFTGSLFAAGTVHVGSFGDYITFKLNASTGDTSWIRIYNGPANDEDEAHALALDAAGNLFVTGHSVGPGTSHDWATVKYNSSGVQQWVQRYNGSANSLDQAYSIAIDNTANIYVGGVSTETGTGNDATIIKYSPGGSQLWVLKYDTLGYAGYCSSVAVDGQNIYMFGSHRIDNVFYDFVTVKYGQPVGITNGTITKLPERFKLYQNYPNPFNPNTIINFQLSMFSYVKLIVYDILGREITTLVNEQLKPGTYEVKWDAANYATGVYYYKLTAGEYNETKKMVLIK